jgi:hypothetical protein
MSKGKGPVKEKGKKEPELSLKEKRVAKKAKQADKKRAS